MGSTTGSYTRPPQTATLFKEEKRFVQVLLQAGKLVVDADWNDFQNSFYIGLRRVIQNTVGDGAVGDAFKVKESSPTPEPHNFILSGGYDPDTGPEMLFLSGHPTKLFEDESYLEGIETSPRSTSLTSCLLTDSAAFFVDDELVGRELIPDITTPANKYTIISNTQNTITVSGASDMIADGAISSDHYRVALTDSSELDRKDIVYLDVYLDEYDKSDDSDIGHALIGSPIEAARRYKLIQNVFVRQGISLSDTYTFNGTTTVTTSSTPLDISTGDFIALASDSTYFEVGAILGTTLTILNPSGFVIPTGSGTTYKAGKLPTEYKNGSGEWIDADGNQHWLLPIAGLLREKGNPFITNSMITDLRRVIFTLDQIEDIFVNVSGDTMTGNLDFSPGSMILGDLVVGFDQLKDEAVGDRQLKRDEHLLADDDSVPSASNLPVVHDNRYFRKSVISLFFGDNKLVNPDFSKGLDIGWDNNEPLPIWGGPAEQVLENAQVRWMVCGPQKCCHGVVTQLSEEYYGCEVHVLCQEVCLCGGGLYVFQQCFEVYAEANIPEGITVRPFVDVLIFSSEQFMGRERHTFGRIVEVGGIPEEFDDTFAPQSGLRTIRTLFDLPNSTDKIILILGYETIFDKNTNCDQLGDPLQLITCKTSLRKFADQGTVIQNEFVPADQPTPQLSNNGPSATIASCESKKVITPECVDNAGKVTFTPGWKQKQLMIYSTPENQGDSALIWGKNVAQALCPTLIETICCDNGTWSKTVTGIGATLIRCFSLSPSSFQSPLVGSNVINVSFTGINFPTGIGDLAITEEAPAPYGANIAITNINVNLGGTSGTFDIEVFDTAPVGSIILRFEDTITLEADQCRARIVKEYEAPPCIYDINEDVLPATTGVPYCCSIIGAHFVNGSTTVTTNDIQIATSIVSVSPNEIIVDIIPNKPNPTLRGEFNITVTTPSGSDSVKVFFVPVSKEYNGTFTEGIVEDNRDGAFPTVTQLLFGFNNGNEPTLTIIGTNLNRIDVFFPIYTHAMPRGSDTLTLLDAEQLKDLDSQGKLPVDRILNKSNFAAQHHGAIEINLSDFISPDTGYMISGFALTAFDYPSAPTTFLSYKYGWGIQTQATITSAKYVKGADGSTGFVIEGMNFSPASFLRVDATLLGYGSKVMYVPVDKEEQGCITVRTKLPIDNTQPCNVKVLTPPYDIPLSELSGHGFNIIGPGTSDKGCSNTVLCVEEPADPIVSCVFPPCGEQGTTIDCEIKGTGFEPSPVVSFGSLINVNSVVTNTEGTSIAVNITINALAALGPRSLSVTNPSTASTYVRPNSFEVKIPEAAIPVLYCPGVFSPSSSVASMEIQLNPSLDAATDVEGTPSTLPFDLTAFRANNGALEFDMNWDGNIDGNVKFYFRDGNDRRSFFDFGLLSLLTPATWTTKIGSLNSFDTTSINWSDIQKIGYVFTPNALPGTTSIKIDRIRLRTTTPAALTILDDFTGYPSGQTQFAIHWFDAGSNHVISLGMPLSRDVTPLIQICDRLQNYSFYGDVGWELADVVLMPSNSQNIANPIQKWIGQPVETEICNKYITYSPSNIPERACRNVYIETMYWTYSGCRAVEAEERMYDVEDPQCACVPPGGFVETLGQMVSDPLLYRIIPDDGFLSMPADYGEALTFEIRVTNNLTGECEEIILGSKSTPNQVYYAGGKRNDPNLPGGAPVHPVTGNPIYIVANMGPGSPQGSRENLIASPLIVNDGDTSATIQLSPSPAVVPERIAVGMSVWIMNYKDPRNNGSLCMTACDVLSNKDNPELYGIYATVDSYDQNTGLMSVSWPDPLVVPGIPTSVTFQPAWSGRVLASPVDRLGYYWEASEGLIDYIDGAEGVVLTWEFKMWAGHAADCAGGLYSGLKECTDIQAGVLVEDGDGETNKFKFIGSTGNVLKESNWLELFSTPTREQCLQVDALIGSNVLSVVDASRFNQFDMVAICDDKFVPGFRTSVQSINLGLNQLILADLIPASLPGFVSFDGFLLSRSAKVFRVVTRVNEMVSPTELQNLDGTPQQLGSQEEAVVDFDAGTITFDPNFEGAVNIFSTFAVKCYQLPATNGVYSFKSINLWNAISEWSQTVSVRDDFSAVPPVDGTQFIARNNSQPPTQDISWANFKIIDVADPTLGKDVVNLDTLNAAIGTISTTNFIARDNSQPPTQDISWGGNLLRNIANGILATDAATVGQIPTNLSRFEAGTYAGANGGTGGSRVISLTDLTLTPQFVFLYHSNVSSPFHSTLAFKILTGNSVYCLESGHAEPFISDSNIISAVATGSFTVGNSTIAVVGADVSGNTYHYLVIGS